MIRMAIVLMAGVSLAWAQQDHDAAVHQHGDHVMGFSHEKTKHHFELHQDGGSIEVRTDDAKDTESRDEIRGHFRHIVQMFAAGNFDAPMLVHSQNVPGTATMTRLKDEIHYELAETPLGARISITTDTKDARNAVHEFLRFQIADHKTGDCTAIR